MMREGYAAVTSRRVEAEAGLKLHYHYGTLDDLFIAVVRRRGVSNVRLLAQALASDEPLRAWWRLASEKRGNPCWSSSPPPGTTARRSRPRWPPSLGRCA